MYIMYNFNQLDNDSGCNFLHYKNMFAYYHNCIYMRKKEIEFAYRRNEKEKSPNKKNKILY